LNLKPEKLVVGGPPTYLATKCFVCLCISLRPIERLLQEGKQHRHNDYRLQCLSEDNEKDGY
jgi:hypothetical protein